MKRLLALSLLVLAAAAIEWVDRFEQFKAKYHKKYLPTEESHRFEVFVDNMKRAQQLMLQNPLAQFGESPFADLTPGEFKLYHSAAKHFQQPRNRQKKMWGGGATNVSRIDWRDYGAVTRVKNQGLCGDCYAFAVTGNIEGIWMLAGNDLVSLSEQEIVSCDATNFACQGGTQEAAFQWLLAARNGSISSEASYPYASQNGSAPTCNRTAENSGAIISDYVNLPQEEDAIAVAVAEQGPISIAVDATSWQIYTEGILTNCIAKQVDHAVLIVGFDDTFSPAYWIIKNSWGKDWGEDGYIRVEKGSNQCLLTTMPSTAVAAKNPHPSPTEPSPTTTNPKPTTTPTPTSTPSPANGTFIQKTCSDAYCSKQCVINRLPQNECLVVSAATSAIATCLPNGLQVRSFWFSGSCQGAAITEIEPLNTCGMGSSGTFIENICP